MLAKRAEQALNQGQKKSAGLIHWLARMVVGRRYGLSRGTFGRAGSTRQLLVDSVTDIVIEGFPRCANTSTVVAFQQSGNQACRIAHHLHVPCQITEGLRLGKPVCLLLRAQAEAVRSLVVREPGIGVQAALLSYGLFHEALLPVIDRLVAAPFAMITSRFGSITRRSKNFRPVFYERQSYDDLDQDVFVKLGRLNKGAAALRRVSSPTVG